METVWVLIGLYFNIFLIVTYPGAISAAVIISDKYSPENTGDVSVVDNNSPYRHATRIFHNLEEELPNTGIAETLRLPALFPYHILTHKRSPQPAEESGLSLSIMSPLDVLRDKMKQQLAIRKHMQKSRTASDNAKLMKEFG